MSFYAEKALKINGFINQWVISMLLLSAGKQSGRRWSDSVTSVRAAGQPARLPSVAAVWSGPVHRVAAGLLRITARSRLHQEDAQR